MVTVLADLDQAASWQAALDGEKPLTEILDRFQATVELAGIAFFYRELIELYPEAKVVLSVREDDSGRAACTTRSGACSATTS